MKSWQEHKWTLDVRIEAQQAHVVLTCADPCEDPYDDESRQVCVCAWNADEPLDVVLEDIPVHVVAHRDVCNDPGWSGDGYDPGWLELAVGDAQPPSTTGTEAYVNALKQVGAPDQMIRESLDLAIARKRTNEQG